MEYGFIDNANDAQKLKTKLDDYVEGAVKALANYAGYNYAPPTSSITNYYTVKKGDSLYSIATKYNTTVETLKTLNNLNSDILSINQQLIVPSINPPTEEVDVYTVQKGDTLYSIAIKFNLSIDKLKELNNLTSNTLSIGQQLIVTEKQLPSPNIIYTVKKGDSLYSIANKYNTTVDAIKLVNNLANNTLSVNQQLIIPTVENILEETMVYIVKRGDSLYSIANTYKTTIDKIIALNNLTSNILQIDQELLLPKQENLQTQPSVLTYNVLKGDSLYSIANKYNTTVDEIKKLNNLTNDILQVGQQLIISESDRSTPKNNHEGKYTVLKGDSLWLIAKKYNTTVTDLINLNKLETISLKEGDRISIPNIDYNHYTVKTGDTLWSIASLNNILVDDLKRLNNLTRNSVTVGQDLIIF